MILRPKQGMHLKNIHSGEIYPGEIIPAKSLAKDDFVEVTEEEYQIYLEEIKKKEEASEKTMEERVSKLESEVKYLSSAIVNQI